MRYLVVGALALAGIVLGSFFALNWALHGTMALAWLAAAFAALGVVVIIACLLLYVLGGGDPGPEPRRMPLGPPSRPPDRAQERAWLREPYRVAPVRPARQGASTSRPTERDARTSERRVAL